MGRDYPVSVGRAEAVVAVASSQGVNLTPLRTSEAIERLAMCDVLFIELGWKTITNFRDFHAQTRVELDFDRK